MTTPKTELVNTLAILMSVIGHEGNLQKLPLGTLQAMYDGMLQNAAAYQLAVESETAAKREKNILESRIRVLEAENTRLVRRVKELNNAK